MGDEVAASQLFVTIPLLPKTASPTERDAAQPAECTVPGFPHPRGTSAKLTPVQLVMHCREPKGMEGFLLEIKCSASHTFCNMVKINSIVQRSAPILSPIHGLQLLTNCSNVGPLPWDSALQEQGAAVWVPYRATDPTSKPTPACVPWGHSFFQECPCSVWAPPGAAGEPLLHSLEQLLPLFLHFPGVCRAVSSLFPPLSFPAAAAPVQKLWPTSAQMCCHCHCQAELHPEQLPAGALALSDVGEPSSSFSQSPVSPHHQNLAMHTGPR